MMIDETQRAIDRFTADRDAKIENFRKMYPNDELVLIEGQVTEETKMKAISFWEIMMEKKESEGGNEFLLQTWLLRKQDALEYLESDYVSKH